MQNQNESLNVSAKTVEEAIQRGLSQLGLTRHQVNIEIVNEGKRGLFGLKSEEAVVRLTPIGQPEASSPGIKSASSDLETGQPTSPEMVPPETHTPTPEDTDQSAGTISTGDSDDQNQKLIEVGTECLTELLKYMGIKAEIKTRIALDLVEPDEKPPLVFDIIGNDLGILIGRRNETLQALQYMVRLIISKEMGNWQRIVVDVESYRARRRGSLRQMAERMAERAVANNERVVLEAMPAYERRLVHIALRDNPAVLTKSIGRDNNRKVTIIPK